MAVFGFSLSYQVGGRDEPDAFQRMAVAFERAGESFERFGDVLFPKLAPLLEEEIKGQFEAEGRGPNKGAFAALSPVYAAQKLKKWGDKPILQASGKMMAALTEAASPNAVRAISSGQFEFGTRDVPWASYHQEGTSKMPARPPIDLTEAFEKEITAAAVTSAREVCRTSGVLVYGEWND